MIFTLKALEMNVREKIQIRKFAFVEFAVRPKALNTYDFTS